MITYIILLVFMLQSTVNSTDDFFKLSIVHMNDFHSRFEETNLKGNPCDTNCVGGFSRLYKQIVDIKEKNTDIVLLNAGDNFQGTIWYNIHNWTVVSHFLNKLPFDAMTLGNHEFDNDIKGVVPFIKSSNFPVVVSNIDTSLEPSFQNITTKSVVIERQGRKIGLIGVITKSAAQISNAGKLIFLDESESINAEAERLVKEEGVFTNIVISHCGYDVEKVLAKQAKHKISLIVGGHSHSYLGDDEQFKPEGSYPTVIKRDVDGATVLVTQASSHSRHLGNIDVYFDSLGNVVNWTGSAIFLSHHLLQDEQINEELKPWKATIESIEGQIFGTTKVPLEKKECKYEECLFGNLVTDLMVYSYVNKEDPQCPSCWTYASIALFNPGGFRANIKVGDITYRDIATAQPFKNTFDVSDIEGKYIKEIFETVAGTNYDNGNAFVSINMLQIAGVQVVIDLNKEPGRRVQSLKIRCRNCTTPVYEDLDEGKIYRILTPSFLTKGGDGFQIISENIKNTQLGEEFDLDIYERYLKSYSPIFQEIFGRIHIIGSEKIKKRHIE